VTRYNAVEDPLCYPGSQVLKNSAGIRNQDDLDQFEQLMFESRAQERLPEGNLDFDHYRALHRHYFQDVYSWAGEIRSIRTGKGGSWFCYPEHIQQQAVGLFDELDARNRFADVESKLDFANQAAWFVSELNAIHPFREGNGRIQLVFLTMLARNAGFRINERKLRPAQFLDAMIVSFKGDLQPLVEEIHEFL
jgi:cell filamentation protein